MRDLLQRSIGSVRQLDLLLLMRDAGTSREWTAGELETTLRSSATAVDADLAGLLQAGLIEVVHGPPTLWRFQPGDRTRTIDELAKCYRTHRTSVVRLVASSSTGSLDQFADAFRLRRRSDTDG